MGLVTSKELCQVVWGIVIKNFMHKYSFIVNETDAKLRKKKKMHIQMCGTTVNGDIFVTLQTSGLQQLQYINSPLSAVAEFSLNQNQK